MNAHDELDADVEAALAALDDAWIDGQSTGEQEQEFARLSGAPGQQLIGTLNALHRLADTPRPSDTHEATATSPERVFALLTLAGHRGRARFGRFEIIESAGRGGSGLVFRARDPRLQRDVALKIPRAETLVSGDARTRFLREASLVASLCHPGIVPVHEAGEIAGIPYIVEQFCPGENLAEWMRRQTATQAAVPCRLAAHWLVQICDALARAHACGIVHRDLKPPNILLEPQAGRTTEPASEALAEQLLPRITDFGIARLLEDTTELTASHALLGTTAYMAPEQARGDARHVQTATDVYALGVILYELLAGVRPFVSDSDADLLKQISEKEPAPVHRLRSDVPRDLSAICMKCLEKSPPQRYASAAELRDDLRRFLDGRPVAARPVSIVKRAVRWCRRRPVHAALIAMVELSLLGAAGGLWLHLNQAQVALEREEKLRQESDDLRIASEEQRTIAEKRGIELQWKLFSLDTQAAWQHLQQGRTPVAQTLLAKYGDEADMTSTFAHRYLSRLFHLEEHIWDLGSEAYWVEFSPDGERLVACAQNKLAVVWNVATREEVRRLEGHSDCVNAARFTSDGRRLWTASCDGTIRQWDAASGTQLGVLDVRHAELETLALSPDGRLLAAGEFLKDDTATAHARLLLYDTELSRLIGEAEFANSRLAALAFSDDGTELAVATGDIRTVFNVASGLQERSRTTASDKCSASGVAWLPGEKTICWLQGSIEQQSHVELQSSDALSPPRKFACARAPSSLAIDAAGSQVVVGTHAGPIELRDLAPDRRGILRQVLYGHTGRVSSLAVSPNGELLASAGFDGKVRLWRLRQTENGRRLLSTLGVDSLFFAAKGDVFVTGPSVTEPFAYATDTWARRLDLNNAKGRALGATPDPDSPLFVVYHQENGNVLAWDAFAGKLIRENRIDVTYSQEHHIRLASNGERFYVAKQPSTPLGEQEPFKLEEWGFNSPAPFRILASYDRPISAIALSERAIAVSTGTSDVDLYDLATAQHRVFAGFHGTARQLAFSGDGTLLAATCEDHNVYLWDADSGQLVLKLSGHESAPLCLAFSADGQELASGDESGEVRIWNLKSRSLSLKIPAHDAPVSSVAFSPDSWILATSSRGGDGHSGEVRVWSAR